MLIWKTWAVKTVTLNKKTVTPNQQVRTKIYRLLLLFGILPIFIHIDG